MIDRLQRAFDRATAASHERQFLRGRLGRLNADGSISMNVPDRQGYVYVTLTGEGNQTVDIALNPYASRIPNLPVKLKRVGGVLVVKEIDDSPGSLETFLAGGTGGSTPPHTHRTGSGLEYEVEAFWLDPGRVLWSGSGVTVRIRPFHYSHEGTEKYYAGGTLDLTSYLPSTSGKWAWILVGLDPSTNSPSAVTGDEYDTQAELTPAEIADIDTSGLIPLGAVQAQEGDTSLAHRSRYADARHWLDAGGGVGDLGAAVHDADSKSAPHDDDEFGYADSENGWSFVKATWAQIKAALAPADNSLTLAKLQQIASQCLLGRNTSGTGNVEVLSALPTSIDALYALLLGRSGGQVLRGGTGSGDDLTLESTNHSTKGNIYIQPSGGNVAIRRGAPPTHHVHIGGSGVQPELALESNAGRKFVMAAYDSDPFTVFGTASSHTFAIISNNTRRMTFHPDGKVSWYGPGSNFLAQTNLHYFDGTTGFAIHSLTINSGTAQTIIANGTGDVTTILYYEAITRPSTGTPAYSSGPLTPSGATSTLYNNGSDNLLIRCTAGGAIEVQRTGGTLTYTVSLRLFWQ